MGWRPIRFFTTSAPTGAATYNITYTGTHHQLNATGSTAGQTVRLPGSDQYPGDEVCVQVINAVAQTVTVQDSTGGTTVDTFAASTNGARVYTWNGSGWVKKAAPT